MWAAYILFGVAITLFFQFLLRELKEESKAKNLALNTKIIELCGNTFIRKDGFEFIRRQQFEKISEHQIELDSLKKSAYESELAQKLNVEAVNNVNRRFEELSQALKNLRLDFVSLQEQLPKKKGRDHARSKKQV